MKHSLYRLTSRVVGLSVLICLAGCGGGGNMSQLADAPGTQEAVRGTVSLHIAWPKQTRGTRSIPDSTTTIRVELADALGQYQVSDITRPAEGEEGPAIVFQSVAGRKVVISAIAFDAQQMPVSWGTDVTYIYSEGEQSRADLELVETPYAWDSENPNLNLAKGKLHWSVGAKPVAGGWIWSDQRLKDSSGQPIPESEEYWNYADMFVAAGGTVYVIIDIAPELQAAAIQVPVVGYDYSTSWNWNGENPCPFAQKYVPLQLSEEATYDLGTINVEASPGADVTIN